MKTRVFKGEKTARNFFNKLGAPTSTSVEYYLVYNTITNNYLVCDLDGYNFNQYDDTLVVLEISL
jgi:hypothetical protein